MVLQSTCNKTNLLISLRDIILWIHSDEETNVLLERQQTGKDLLVVYS